ncbi:MAG: CHASE domain-containing protein [Halopseudomonas sp.]|uniref:CHASE domain-containing protein n=1 Tax=Halopseudomonas sp. TaxID=2901191 RepID=UPI00300129A5
MPFSRSQSFSLGRAIFSKQNALAWLVLVIALLTTLLVWQYLQQREQAQAQQQFDIVTSELTSAIRKRMVDHEQILLGAAGLFDASQEVTRGEWRAQIERLRLTDHYPGIMGVGFAQAIKPAELEALESQIKAEGFAGFHVHPAGDRELYTPIIYLEPFSGRNLAAFGYDMYSEDTRRLAMQTAARSGHAAVTGPVELVQETHGQVQAGILMYVPVYRNAVLPQPATEADRQAALRGFVYSPYRMGDLLAGILGQTNPQIAYQLSDITDRNQQRLLHQSHKMAAAQKPRLSRENELELYGRHWQLTFQSTPQLEAAIRSHVLVLVLGVGLSLMLFLLASLLNFKREQAEALAARMTEKMRASTAALQQSEERQRLVLKGSNDGWWDVDLVEWRFMASARAWEMLGYPQHRGSQPLHRWQALITPASRHRLLRQLQQALSSDVLSFSCETRCTHKEGAEIPLLLRGAIQRDAQGKAVRASGTMLDLTEQKRVEAMKSEFVSTVSHELRTPLTSISGALGIVNSGSLGAVPENMQKLLEIAHSNSLRLNHLINDLLDMEKLAAGKMAFDMRIQRIDTLTDDAIAANQAYADKHQVSLQREPGDEYWAEVDGIRLHQVLSNFLSNAVKFSPPDSVVRVVLERRDALLRISVIDHGDGIPEAFQPQIFSKFAQADSADNRQKPGTGLGLAISRDLIERMGGEVGFESIPRQGATFWLELPLVVPDASADVVAQPLAAPTPPRVLILDDDETVAEFMALILRRGGYEPVLAHGLRAAKRILAQQLPDALVTDLRLPDGHGLNLIRELRLQSATRNLPILVVSAYCDEGQRLLDGGVQGVAWLDKPIEEFKLLPVLADLITRMQTLNGKA